jgi:hypothetical protein
MACGLEEGFEALRTASFPLVVLDYEIVNTNSRDDLRLLRQVAPTTPTILEARYRTKHVEADAAQSGLLNRITSGDFYRG